MTDGLQVRQDNQIIFFICRQSKKFIAYVGDELPMVNEASKSKNKISINRRK
jgi:hypothetical protein